MDTNTLQRLSSIKYGMEEIQELIQYYKDQRHEFDLLVADRKQIIKTKNPKKLSLYINYFE